MQRKPICFSLSKSIYQIEPVLTKLHHIRHKFEKIEYETMPNVMAIKIEIKEEMVVNFHNYLQTTKQRVCQKQIITLATIIISISLLTNEQTESTYSKSRQPNHLCLIDWI